jgi:predicted RNase H-like HicB family nuclease
MLSRFIRAALHDAKYDWMDEDMAYFGTIDGLLGVWATAPTVEACREELIENLEEWILFSLTHRIEVPRKGGINLNLRTVDVG